MNDRYAAILQDEEGVSPTPMDKYSAIVFHEEGTEEEPGIHLTPKEQKELEASAEAAWKAQSKTGLAGGFGQGLVAPMQATARGVGLAALSHDTLKQHLENAYAKATHAPEITKAGKVGEFIGGLAGNVLQAMPIARAFGTPGLIAQFGSQGAYDEFLRAGMRALSEGKTLDEATDIGRQASLGGAEVGAVLGAVMPGVGPSTMRAVLGQAARLGGVATGGRIAQNLLERGLGLQTPPLEGAVEEGATMGLFPVGTHLAGRGLGRLIPPPPSPEAPRAPLALPERTGPIIPPPPAEPLTMTGIEEQLRGAPVVAPRELPGKPLPQLPERTGAIALPDQPRPPQTLAEVEAFLRNLPPEEPPAEGGVPVGVPPKPPAPAPAAPEPAAPAAQPKGEPYASRVETPTEVHGDLRSLAGEGEGKMPVKEGGEGVQPQTEKRVSPSEKAAEVLLTKKPAETAGEESPIVPLEKSRALTVEDLDTMFSHAESMKAPKNLLEYLDDIRSVLRMEKKVADIEAENASKISSAKREDFRRGEYGNHASEEAALRNLESETGKYWGLINDIKARHSGENAIGIARNIEDLWHAIAGTDYFRPFNKGPKWANELTSKLVKPTEVVGAEPPSPKPKEPWEMTKEEYREKEASGFDSLSTMPEGKDVVGMPVKKAGEHKKWQAQQRQMAEQTRQGKNETVDMMHRRLVQQAIERGKPVPPEVLKDYADLQKPQPPAAPTTPAEGVGKGVTPERLLVQSEQATTKRPAGGKPAGRLRTPEQPATPSSGGTPSLPQDPKSVLLREWMQKATSLDERSRWENDTRGGIAAGATGFDAWLKSETTFEYLRNIRKGMSADNAAAATKTYAREAVAKHNQKRPRDMEWQRDSGTGDTHIDRIAEDFRAAEQPTPAAPAEGQGPMEPQRRKTLREIREQNKLGGQAGFIDLGIIADKIKELQDQIAIAYKNGKVRAAMTWHKDAADNSAARYANEIGNDTRNILFRAIGTPIKATEPAGGSSIFQPWKDPNSLPKTALTHAVESFSEMPEGSSEAGVYGLPRLHMQLSRLISWTPPNASFSQWKQTMVNGLNYAIGHWNELQPAIRRYQNETRTQYVNETAHGIDTLYRNGYVLHEQDLTPNSLFNFLTGRGGDVNAQFLKTRTHPTYVDSLMAGVLPKSLDSIALLKARVNAGQKRINNKAWVEGLRGMTDETSGKPVLTDPQIQTRPDGKTYPVAPDPDYELTRLGYETYAIHKGYEGVFDDLTKPSRLASSLGGRALMKTAGSTKHLVLAFDTFHLGRLALWSSIIQSKPVGYKKGLVLLDYSIPEIQEMARRGEIPREYLADITENKRKLDLATKTGYNMARIQDALWQDWVQKIPVTGAFNKWLFGQFQRGAMVESWLHEFDRQRRQNPTLPEDTVARNVSRELNTRFGNLQSQGVFRSKSMQDVARLLFLAPQWNEGLIRSEIGAVTGAGRTALDLATKDKFAMNALTRSAGILFLAQFAANQLINYITRGHSTLENPEEGIDSKISAYVPDIVGEGPGLFISPVALPAETAHLIYKRFEKSKDFDEALSQYLRTRLGTVARPMNTWWTKTDPFGRAIRPDELWNEILKAAYPIPIAGGAAYQAGRQIATGERAEQFPGQFQKQSMASVGVRTESVPTATQQMSTLAKDWNQRRGVRVPGQFYQSDYANLDRFLRIGNSADALKELELIRQKHSDDQIAKRYQALPEVKFTHSSSENEARFYSTLNDEQKSAYIKARMERMQLARRFWQLWSKRGTRALTATP